MANTFENTYSDPRYGTKQDLYLPNIGQETSVQAAVKELGRLTFNNAVRIEDVNFSILTGATQTGTAAAARNGYTVGKSLGGTGTVSSIATLFVGGTHADATVNEATVTKTNLVSGDDLVFQINVGTGLAISKFRVDAQVTYVENFT